MDSSKLLEKLNEEVSESIMKTHGAFVMEFKNRMRASNLDRYLDIIILDLSVTDTDNPIKAKIFGINCLI